MDDYFYNNVIEYAMANGMLMKTSMQECTHSPLTIFPTPIPKNHFEELKRIQPHINKLMYLASQDHEFLVQSLRSVFESDEFSRNLLNVYEKARANGTKSKFECGILRSDYMFDSDSTGAVLSPKQIEINTIAASFGGVSGNRIRTVHTKALKDSNRRKDVPMLPRNSSTEDIAKGLVDGWNAYGCPSASIVFLVLEVENNIFDQRAVEYAINSLNDNICVRRRTFKDVISNTKLEDGKLFIQGEEVAVMYFRCGYQPKDYSSSKHWDARLTIEKSKAIKCPSVALQLTGCKKFQEVLARPGSVERFIDKEAAAAIRRTFAGLYTLEMEVEEGLILDTLLEIDCIEEMRTNLFENSEGNRAVEMALSNPENFVMKPQREGGGNNIYGEDIVPILQEIGHCDKRTAYILMDRIRPKSAKNHIALKYAINEFDCVSELGIFGIFLAKEGQLLHNYSAGHILRTKAKNVNEGGIMAGAAVLDSPLLV